MSNSFLELFQNFITWLGRVFSSPAFKFILVCFLLLVLTIPLIFIGLLNYERTSYANRAVSDVSSMWGTSQTVRGPYLIVPTIKRQEIKVDVSSGKTEKVETRIKITKQLAVFLPENLKVKSDVKTEIRKRGIFSVPVYRSVVDISGSFISPDTDRIKRDVDEIIWDDAILVVMFNDVTAIKKNIILNVNDGAYNTQFRAGTLHNSESIKGIHAPVKAEFAKGAFSFAMQLHLNGSSGLHFVPAGGETANTMTSDWPHPSFSGVFLPDTREISDKGFNATWNVPRLARGQSQEFLTDHLHQFMGSTVFGVDFYQPSGFYNLIERSLKYAIGFIAIAFFAVFIMEVQSRRRVHWIQYIFVGLALSIFYLVLLGISEHTGFETAYAASSLATGILIAVYVGSTMKSFIHGLSIFGVLTIIYGLLYLLLRMEDYAMLIGSIAAFILLAIVMFSTRSVDWTGSKPDQKISEGENR